MWFGHGMVENFNHPKSLIIERGTPLKSLGKVALAACFALACAGVSAQTFQKWEVYDLIDAPVTMTINDSGNGFGQVCSDEMQDCFWVILTSKTACESGTETPILVNASSGSFAISSHCSGVVNLSGTNYHRYILSTHKQMTTIVQDSSGLIGFAIPLESGLFSVLRFDLSGSRAALKKFDKLFDSFNKRVQNSSTKDRSL